MMFWLGSPEPVWLARTTVPLMVSRRRMERTKIHRALGPWMLDSGGFTEVSQFGGWRTDTPTFVASVRRIASEAGMPDFAAPQDWMCEPFVLERTGLSLQRHQSLTVRNLLELRTLAPEVPWLPVLQGWTLDDYLRCAALYDREGINLGSEPLVGLGSVCRRQDTAEAAKIVTRLASEGLTLHCFGVKLTGLRTYGHLLASADSMAWSFQARRRNVRLPDCTHSDCRNCLRFALAWRERVVA